MDYLDPRKQFQHRIIMLVGYVFVAIAIVIATLILLYQAYGFGLGKNGTVIQNSLAFFSSHPHPANIYINGTLNNNQTNARIALPSGIYRIQLTRDGYRPWQRTIELDGGSVEHFDYPLLIPKTLTSKKLQTYPTSPGLATQSPNRRWLVVQQPNSMTDFDVYDLKNPAKAPTKISLPADLLAKATANESWQLEEWADDNQHIVLQHSYDGRAEFILLNRTDPGQSANLNKTLSANPAKLSLADKKYDHYYLYDPTSGLLQRASLSSPTGTTALEHALAYQPYGSNGLLYVTDANAPAGKVLVRLLIGDQTYAVRNLPAGSTYLLDLAKYSGDLYVAAGASSQDKVYIYKDPIGQLKKQPNHALVPSQVLHVPQPNYVSFSTNAQFIVVENGIQFGVYDIENTRGYNYSAAQPLDPPMTHATWMDGDRLTYVSQGRLLEFDYDGTNQQILVNASSSYLPAFAPDYRFIYSLAPGETAGQVKLLQTSLLAPAK